MKIGISVTGPDLDAEADPRFGRCRYFVVIDPETMQFESIDNSSAATAGGAGIATAQMIAGTGVEAILTGNCGPNAHQALSSAGIKVMTGIAGKVRDAIESYKLGQFEASTQPNVTDHFGSGFATGSGGGMGRGMGRGCVEDEHSRR